MPIIETAEQLVEFLEQNEAWRRKIYNILVPCEGARLLAELEEFQSEVCRERESVRHEMREGFEQVHAQMREDDERLERKKNTGALAQLKGSSLEQSYRHRARASFGRYLRSVSIIDWANLEEPLEAAAPLTEKAREELSGVDFLVRGRRKIDGPEVVLVIEISWLIAPSDVGCAVRRAEILSQRGWRVTPVVAGRAVEGAARGIAQAADCALLTEGHFEFEIPLREA